MNFLLLFISLFAMHQNLLGANVGQMYYQKFANKDIWHALFGEEAPNSFHELVRINGENYAEETKITNEEKKEVLEGSLPVPSVCKKEETIEHPPADEVSEELAKPCDTKRQRGKKRKSEANADIKPSKKQKIEGKNLKKEHKAASKNLKKNSHKRRYKCSLCGDKFNFSSNLNRHKKRTHKTGEKLYCQKCPKFFYHTGCLRDHEYIHTKKPYTCETCEHSFLRPYQLKRHQNSCKL